jgi:hypothetical protein
MSDERELTPEQEAHVARLLADARHTAPMPAEVAARLDGVLAGMASEQVPGPDQQVAPVIDLGARRRRRAATLLVAAAAVVVTGVGIGQMVGSDGSDDADNATSADGGGGNDRADELSPEEVGPGAADQPMTDAEIEALGEPARLTAASFATKVRRLQDRPGLDNADGAMVSGEDLAAPSTGFTCERVALPAGKLIAVRYNGSPAVLVYKPPAGDTQVVDLVQCGSGETLRSTTIPLP